MTDDKTTPPGDQTVEMQPPAPAQPLARLLDTFDKAVASGIDVEALERLQAMLERAQDREAAQQYTEAMVRFHETCPEIPKKRTGKIAGVSKKGARYEYEYKYAKLEDMLPIVKPVLLQCGIVLSWDREFTNTHVISTAKARHAAGHVETSSVSMPLDSTGGASDQQKNGIAMSYADRYAAAALLGIRALDAPDLDGADVSERPGEAGPITAKQKADIFAILDEIEDGNALFAFTEYMGVERVDDIPQMDFKRAMTALRKKQASEEKARG